MVLPGGGRRLRSLQMGAMSNERNTTRGYRRTQFKAAPPPPRESVLVLCTCYRHELTKDCGAADEIHDALRRINGR